MAIMEKGAGIWTGKEAVFRVSRGRLSWGYEFGNRNMGMNFQTFKDSVGK